MTRFLAQAVILRCTKNVIDFPWVFENLNSLSPYVTQQPSSQILQVINHKKAKWISFQTNINVEVLLQQYSFRNWNSKLALRFFWDTRYALYHLEIHTAIFNIYVLPIHRLNIY